MFTNPTHEMSLNFISIYNIYIYMCIYIYIYVYIYMYIYRLTQTTRIFINNIGHHKWDTIFKGKQRAYSFY